MQVEAVRRLPLKEPSGKNVIIVRLLLLPSFRVRTSTYFSMLESSRIKHFYTREYRKT